MMSFDLVEPASLKEAIALLDPEDETVRPISGGTALMLMMKAGVFQPSRLVSLGSVEPRYSEIAATTDGGLRIGALASLSAIERSTAVAGNFPVIVQTMKRLSNVRVRNVARIGGNLAHGDPHMDLPPVLSALDARVVIAGPSGERQVAVEDLFAGYYETVLEGDELIVEVVIPPRNGRVCAYLKCTTRSADDWPTLGVAVSLDLDCGAVRDARVMISAATEKLTRLREAEAALRGAEITDASLSRAGEAALAETTIIDDSRGSAAYKRQLVRVYLERAVRQALASAAGQNGAPQ